MGMSKRAARLMALADAAGVLKKEAQEITHKKLDASQPTIGNEMQKEVESGSQGNYASDQSVDAELKGTVEMAPEKIEGDEDKKAEKVLSETGSSIEKMYPCGTPASAPADVVKSAAFKTRIESAIKAEMAKEAAFNVAQAEMVKQAAANEDITTATEVLSKIASLNDVQTQEDFIKIASDIEVSFQKLQETNPLFNIAVEHKLMEKQAAEIDALAAENNMAPEDAAAALDAATEADPEAAAEMQNEAEGEALSDLAGAEQEQAALMDGLDDTAAQVSEMLGQEVTGDDIAQAVSDVVDAAEQMGVEPEVLLEAAAQELMGAGDGEPSEEDMAQAQEILDQAAAEGVSPEEVIQAVAQEMEGGEGAADEGGAEEASIEPSEEDMAQAQEIMDQAAAEGVPPEEVIQTVQQEMGGGEGAADEGAADEGGAEEAPAEDMDKEAAYHEAVNQARQETLVKLASTKRGANLMKVLSNRA